MAKDKKRKRGELYIHSTEDPLITRTLDISDDRRYVRTKFGTATVAASPLAAPECVQRDDILPTHDAFQWQEDAPPSVVDEVPGVTVLAKTKSRRYDSTAAPLLVWLKHRDEYLDETLRLEGRGDHAGMDCLTCKDQPTVRCRDCAGACLECRKCALASHARHPLHILDEWHGDHFEQVSLQELGLWVQLGHGHGLRCPTRSARELTVLHVNGIHKVNVYFCNCNTSIRYYHQLLRYAWWPATPIDPHTCATMAVLRLFHNQNLQGHITAYDFYHSLENMTDSRRLSKVPDRLQSFMLMIRQWRNCKILKRRGRGYEAGGINTTAPGMLALPCRACPHPGINLPSDWQDSPPFFQFLYWLFLAQDANFRIKNRHRPTTYIDVCLTPGWAYFVETKAYLAHVATFATQEEISSCVGFLTLALANLKKAKGLSSTGIGGCACSRHEIWRPNGIGDLQRGERYCNMDYILLSSIVGISVLTLVVSYDIACQFFKNFFKRMERVPSHLQCKLPPSAVIAKVPKVHLENHQDVCHGPYSFNYTNGAGRSDGEGIERLWSWLNKAAPSVKEMGPSARRETIDDFCGYSAWRKTVGLCALLTTRMLEALKQAHSHQEEFNAFDAALRRECPALVADWEKMVLAWEADHSLPCPYQSTRKKVTLKDAKLALAQEEERRTAAGETTAYDSSPSAFIMFGLEVEALQESLKEDVRREPKVSTLQEANRLDQRTSIRKKLLKLREMQRQHMPGLAQLLRQQNADANNEHHAEDLPLYLPSHLFSDSRGRACDKALAEIEDRLRFAQAHEALDNLRQQLRARMFANRFKVKNVTGVRKNTAARTWQKAIDDKALACKHRYRRAREALTCLRGHGGWEDNLRELTDDDVRAVNERALTAQEKTERQAARRAGGLLEEEVEGVPVDRPSQVGEGRRTISWIWYTTGLHVDEGDDAMSEAVRIEWAKSRSRSLRWTEEVLLLDEEMRRAVVFSEWEAAAWKERATGAQSRVGISEELREGLMAYAFERAQAELNMAGAWAAKFAPLRECAKSTRNSWMRLHGGSQYTSPVDDSNDGNADRDTEGVATEQCPMPIVEVVLDDFEDPFGDDIDAADV